VNIVGNGRLSPLKAQEAVTASLDIPVDSLKTQNRLWRKLLRPQLIERGVSIVDFALIIAAALVFSLAYDWITAGKLGTVIPFVGIGILVAANFVAVATARRNYRLKPLAVLHQQTRETVVIWSATYGLLAIAGFTMKISNEFSRGAVILVFVGGLAALLCWRWLVAELISKALASNSFARKSIIVIAEQGQNFSSPPLSELRRYGYNPVKTCEISRGELISARIPPSLRSKLTDLIQVARSEQIEDIYLSIRWSHHRVIDGILDALAVLPISVHLVADESAARFLNYPAANIGDTWAAVLKRAPLTRLELAAKRCFDVVLATIALAMLLPLMLITALLIKFDSQGPVLFLQKRNGFNGGTFDIIKFRTMHVLENDAAVRQATRNDPRVTRLGRWLRRSSIDELPQLFNVIRGEMSLVGPRPHATLHNSEYEKLIANYAFRHHVKPGLTGWAQVNGFRGETRHIEQMESRVEHDLWYINNWSLWLDFKIVLQTLFLAFRHDTAF
jgi:Undecaprenyl-phosphate glucose phosphotransferase